MEPTTAIKLGGAATAVAAVPLIFGVSGATIMAACAGALASMAYRKPEAWNDIIRPVGETKIERRIKSGAATLFVAFTLVSSAFVASWAVLTIPHIPGFAWVGEIPRGPVAGLLAFSCQWLIPTVINAAKSRIEKLG